MHLYGDASRGWCLTDKIPLYGPQKNVIGLSGISRDLHNPGEKHAEFSQVADAVEYVRKHYMDNLRIRELASRVGLSLSRFERLVSKIYGLNPNQLLIKARIDAASRLLVAGNKSIAEIAYSCGYADHSAFTRQFRSAVGVTPSQFRAAQRERKVSSPPDKRSQAPSR
jgi:AraC-like DNA-binding protein